MIGRSPFRSERIAGAALFAIALVTAAPVHAALPSLGASRVYTYTQGGRMVFPGAPGGWSVTEPSGVVVLGLGRRMNERVNLELEAMSSGTQFVGTPTVGRDPLTSHANSRSVWTRGYTGWIRVAPQQGFLRPYWRVGLGLYGVTVSGEGAGSPLRPAGTESHGTTVGMQAGVGVEARIGERGAIGVETRYLHLNGHFAPWNAGSAGAGGAYWTFAFRRHFPGRRREPWERRGYLEGRRWLPLRGDRPATPTLPGTRTKW